MWCACLTTACTLLPSLCHLHLATPDRLPFDRVRPQPQLVAAEKRLPQSRPPKQGGYPNCKWVCRLSCSAPSEPCT